MNLQENRLTKQVLSRLLVLYSEDLFHFVKGMVKNNEISEELVSDVFVKLWDNREDFDKIRDIKSYLFISARNRSISYLRKESKIKLVSIDEVADFKVVDLYDDEAMYSQDVIDTLNRAIDSLPQKCKMAFSLAKINGLKYKEVAEIMEISPKTVKNHIAYAIEKIGGYLAANEGRCNTAIGSILFFILRSIRSPWSVSASNRFRA